MMGDVLLAADITQLLTALVPIVFFVIYVINQFLAAKAKPQQQGRNPQRRTNQPRAERAMRRPQQAQGQPPGDASQLNAEIEQFLKRANQRRGKRPPPERAAPASAAPQAPAPMKEQPIDVAPIDGEFGSVSASVDSHLGHRGFGEHLAEEVGQADEEMERHLSEAFDHRVGTLRRSDTRAGAPSEETAETTSMAATFAELLRTPQGMRQAIVLGEILARPEDRW